MNDAVVIGLATRIPRIRQIGRLSRLGRLAMTSAAEYVQRDAVELPRIPDRTFRPW